MKTQSGNILFLILIAIALLGGLTVLMTRTGSQSDDTGDTERSSIAASEILKYAASLQSATQNLIGRGCSENVLSFEMTGVGQAVGYNNVNAPADKSCHIFQPEGAGLKYKKHTDFFPNGVWATIYNDIIGRSAIPGLGTSAAELYWVLELPENSAALCRMINSRLGFADPTPLASSVWGAPFFAGTFSAPDPVATAGLTGKKSFCIAYSGDVSRHHFVSVLIVR